MIKETPILMSVPMVKATLEGMKNMTRRQIKDLIIDKESGYVFFKKHKIQLDIHHWKEDIIQHCPYGQIGDLLWVREKWAPIIDDKRKRIGVYHSTDGDVHPGPWKPSIHMPKKDSRLWLEITDVRVELLHDINQSDILLEGVRIPVTKDGGILLKLWDNNSAWNFMPKDWYSSGKDREATEQELLFAHWAELWCTINGRASWDANPWLWVLSFKKAKQLITK